MAKKNHCGSCQRQKTFVIMRITFHDPVSGPDGAGTNLCLHPKCRIGKTNLGQVAKSNSKANFPA